MQSILEGVRVLELCRVLAGPWACQSLADMGADVIKVEHPVTGDDTREWGPPYLERPDGGRSSESAYYLGANRNKRSIALDFTKPEGQAIIRDLIRQTDVVVENFRPGALAKYGLDYASLKAINPAIVYCSITGFGQQSPRSHQGGYDFIIQALAGLMSVTGLPDGVPGGAPMKVGVPVSDLFTGLYAVVGILSAYIGRLKTGRGQHVDISLMDAQVATLVNQGMNYLIGGEVPQRLGNDHPNVVPCGLFATTDGHIVFAVGNDGQFRRFAEALELAGVADDPCFRTNRDRHANRAALNELIAGALGKQSTDHWVRAMELALVPAAPVNTIDAVFADAHSLAHGLRVEMEHPYGIASVIANPLRFSEQPVSYRRAPPLKGQHGEEILRDELGMTDVEIEQLRAARVLA